MANTGKLLLNATQECNANNFNITNDISGIYLNETSSSSNEISETKQFDWNSDQQGLVLGSYFYGYIPTQIIGGIIADKYNPVISYGLGIVIFSFISLFTPIATNSIGIPGMVTVRILCRVATLQKVLLVSKALDFFQRSF